MKLVSVKIGNIKPYENNPRYNDDAIEAVKESIKQCEYITPIVLDENFEMLAGHTRYAALYQLGYQEAECIVVTGLTDKQKRKFRLLDNKTAEIAEWDIDLLIAELDGLDFGSLDLFEKEMQKAGDKLIKEHEATEKVDKEDKLVICPRCGKPIVGFVELDEDEEPELSYEEYEQEN